MKKETFIVANWKMNLNFLQANNFVNNLSMFLNSTKIDTNIIICPQFLLLHFISTLEYNKNIKIGAQNCHSIESGAFTGETSIELLESLGCHFVIIGHSERRIQHKESDSEIKKKAITALKHNITPIICIGEKIEIRKQKTYLEFLSSQILSSIPNINDDIIIAYEPIWSIGTGIIPKIEEINEISDFITNTVKKEKSKIKNTHILYGGSVNSKNSKSILDIKNINGLLVGGASLDSREFIKILKKR